MTDLIGIGVSGLSAYQRALATTSNNVANLQTEGYVRQRAVLASSGQDGGSAIDVIVDFLMPRDADIVKNDPPLISDFDAAVAGVLRSSFTNSGQVCLCSERVYVERPIFERFVAALPSIIEAYERNEAATALRLTMALADEANKYIDETKPWVIAKQEGADAELQAVCTQGLNLFRILAAALKPVLPRTSAEAEAFLGAPVESWTDVAAPLQAHTIQPYSPLFTRIDPKLIDAMTDASKDTLAAAPAAPAAPAKKAEATPAASVETKDANGLIGLEDFARLDLRIGKVLECGFVEGSDKLLRFLLDAGDLGQRQIYSGIRGSYGEPEKLVGRKVVFIATANQLLPVPAGPTPNVTMFLRMASM